MGVPPGTEGSCQAAGLKKAALCASFYLCVSVWGPAPTFAEDLAKIASLEVATAPGVFDEYGPARFYLIVRNLSGHSIAVENVPPYRPAFVNILMDGTDDCSRARPDPKKIAAPIGPGGYRVFSVLACPGDNARPGKHTLVLAVEVRWKEGDAQAQGVLTSVQSIDIGVVAESAILKVLEVPSFLLLPGFLTVSTWLALRRRWLPDPKKQQPETLTLLSKEFWLLAISASLLCALSYPVLTLLLFRQPRNYLGGYGLRDVVYVWSLSLFAGALGAGIVASLPLLRRFWLEPQPGDRPVVALRKAARSRGSMFSVGITGKKGTYFLYRQRDGIAWVAPTAQWQWLGSRNDPGYSKLTSEIRKGPSRLEKLWTAPSSKVTEAHSPKAIASLLHRAEKKGLISVGWERRGELVEPTPVIGLEVQQRKLSNLAFIRERLT